MAPRRRFDGARLPAPRSPSRPERPANSESLEPPPASAAIMQRKWCSLNRNYVVQPGDVDVPTLPREGAGHPLFAQRTGTARGGDPRCHDQGVPRGRPRAVQGERPARFVRDLETYIEDTRLG